MSTMSTNTIIVLAAFVAYMGMMILIGALNSKNKNNEDYFLGGRGLGSWTAALSAQASDMSGWLLMGLPGAIYVAGTGEVWIAIGLLIGTVLNWFLVARRLRKYTIIANNSLTIPSFFENRFHDKKGVLKIVSSIVIIVFFAVYTASAFVSGAKLFKNVFGQGADDNTAYIIGLVVATVVILVYTLLGGFRAVCYTDFIQGLLMLVAILAVPIIAYISVSGDLSGAITPTLDAAKSETASGFLSLFQNKDGSSVTFVSIISNLGWALGYFGMPHILVRFMAIKSDKEVKKSRIIAIVWVILSLGAASFLGLVARGFVSEDLEAAGTSESVFIKTIQQIFDNNVILVFIGGIFLCGILAAIMSTADSQLLVTASSVSEDMYKGVIKKDASEKSALNVGRIAVAVTAVVAFLIALDPDSSVMKLVSDAWAGFGAAFGPVILLSLFWKRFNLSGAVSGMITGFLTIIIWDYIPFFGYTYTGKGVEGVLNKINGSFYDQTGALFTGDVTSTANTFATETALYSLVIGFALALVVAVAVTLATKAPSKEITDEFEKVQTVEI